MRNFDDVKGYATPANAEKKLRKVFGAEIERTHWFIGVNSAGRFFPIVRHSAKRSNLFLTHHGICVVGSAD